MITPPVPEKTKESYYEVLEESSIGWPCSVTTIEKALSELKNGFIIKVGAWRKTAYIRNHDAEE